MLCSPTASLVLLSWPITKWLQMSDHQWLWVCGNRHPQCNTGRVQGCVCVSVSDAKLAFTSPSHQQCRGEKRAALQLWLLCDYFSKRNTINVLKETLSENVPVNHIHLVLIGEFCLTSFGWLTKSLQPGSFSLYCAYSKAHSFSPNLQHSSG